MTLSDISVRRPVLAAVASLLIVVFGIAALQDLPIRELPDVDTAVVTVTTTYRGAASEVIDTDITETIEGAVSTISGFAPSAPKVALAGAAPRLNLKLAGM